MAKMAKDRSKHMVSVFGPGARSLTIHTYLKPETSKDATDQSFSVAATSFKLSGTALAPLEEEHDGNQAALPKLTEVANKNANEIETQDQLSDCKVQKSTV